MDASAQVLQIYKVMCGVCDAGGDRQLAQKLLILSFLQHQASDVKGGHAIQEKRDVCLTFTCNKTILTVRLSAACGTPTPNRPMPLYSAQLLRRHYCPSSLLGKYVPKTQLRHQNFGAYNAISPSHTRHARKNSLRPTRAKP